MFECNEIRAVNKQPYETCWIESIDPDNVLITVERADHSWNTAPQFIEVIEGWDFHEPIYVLTEFFDWEETGFLGLICAVDWLSCFEEIEDAKFENLNLRYGYAVNPVTEEMAPIWSWIPNE